MNWFFLALIAPFLWAIVNHVDKYLLSNEFNGRSINSLMIFSTLIGVFVLPIAYLVDPSIFAISSRNALLLIAVGIMSAIAIALYLYALEEEETSIVVALFQTIPLFGALFAYIMLGETLTTGQLFGCLIIVLGSVLITAEFNEDKKIRFKKKVLYLMLGSAALFGFYETLFKAAALDESFWVSTFWEHIGLVVVAITLLIVPRYRKDFIALASTNGKKIISLNVGSEVLTIAGNILVNYAMMLAPVALVLTTSSVQPLIVFIMGIAMTMFFPRITQERISKKHILQKVLAICILFVGVVMIQ
jgi:drug/metabolite transporter (DMT)-like permease